MEKDKILNFQIKLTDVLITKKDIQIIDQRSVLDNISILDIIRNFVKGDKEKMKRNQLLRHYLKGLKTIYLE